MIRVGFLIAGGATILGYAFAGAQQQPPDPAFLQRAILSVQSQRNTALDGQAACEASRGGLIEEIEKLKARIKELEPTKKELEPTK